MAISTNKVARLSFTTAGGKAFTISIPNPQEDVNQADVLAIMNSVVESNIFLTASGAITGIRDAKIVDTSTNDLFDPPQA